MWLVIFKNMLSMERKYRFIKRFHKWSLARLSLWGVRDAASYFMVKGIEMVNESMKKLEEILEDIAE